MKYYLLHLLSAFFLVSSTCNAQSPVQGWRMGFGITAGIPATKVFSSSLGGDIRVQKNFSERIAGTLTAGFTHYFEKDHYAGFPEYSSPFNVIPVKAGVKIFMVDHLYIAGEAGAGFGLEEWGTSFLWSPSLGFAFHNGIDLSLKYEDYTRNAQTKNIALRVAYGFNMQKSGLQKAKAPEAWTMGIFLNPGEQANTFDNFVLGADVSLKKKMSRRLEASLMTGFSHYSGDYYNSVLTITTSNVPIVFTTKAEQNIIPVEAGIRLFGGDSFYVSGQAGAAFGLRGTTTFMYTPSAGLIFKNGFEIGAKYDIYHSQEIPEVVSLKLGYNFKL